MGEHPNVDAKPAETLSVVERRALLARLLQEKTRKHREFPLSPAQQRLWTLWQLDPDTPAYNIPAGLRCRDLVDAHVLERCFTEIVRRHEILRATFTEVDGQPLQVIAPAMKVTLPVTDLRHLPPEERETEMLRRAEADARRPFDLRAGPLFRFSLLLLAESDVVILFNMHHIISDGWSLGILRREMELLYQAFAAGKPSPFPDLPIQYVDYAIWQQQQLQADRLDGLHGYWEKKLAGAPERLDLPTDRPRPAVRTFNGADYSLTFPAGLSQALKDLSRQASTTLFSTLLAAFNVLLHRYTHQADVLVGTAVANRNRTEVEDLIGFFVNTLVIRTNLTGNPRFCDLLAQVRQTVAEAHEHHELPFEQLVELIAVERDTGRSPLFQVAFALQETVIDEDDSSASLIQIGTGTSEFDLFLLMIDDGRQLKAYFQYNPDLFDASTLTRLAGHFQTLLAGIVANPAQRVAHLPLLDPAAQSRMLAEWNATAADYPRQACVQRLFEDQVARTPDATAVISPQTSPGEGGVSWSYASLNAQANQLAHYLQKKGVGPGSIVALLDERTPEMLVATLAVVKAGGVYLPLDPHNPTDRIVSMLEDSQAQLLLTRSRFIIEKPVTRLQRLHNVRDSVVVTDSRLPISNLDSLPFPDRSLVDYGKYDQYISDAICKKSISIVATRGCPYRCLYCHKIWPKKHFFRSAENIFQEIQLNYDRGYTSFVFVDDVFNLNRRNSTEFFERVIRSNMKLRLWFPNGLRGDLLTHDYIDLLSEAGVVQMDLALETASPRMQRLIQKNIKLDKIRENLVYICNRHPHIILGLFTMLGFPTETEDEALMTLDFIKSIRWLHFPYVFALKIFPNTEMARLAMENGVPRDLIERSTHLAYHEPSETLPFSKEFVRAYQASFIGDYFLSPERLEHVIPIQKRVLTHDELVAVYETYLPGGLESYPDIARLIGAAPDGAEPAASAVHGNNGHLDPVPVSIAAPAAEEARDRSANPAGGLRILLLDLSQFFSSADYQLNGRVEAPLGLMYLLTYLKGSFGDRIQGTILKAMIDFDSFEDLKRQVDQLQPQVIGIRTLSLYRDFFHQAVSLLAQWCPGAVIVTGGPYATSEYPTLLSDPNVDLVVLGEGELTFADLIGRMLENDGRLPEDETLKKIAGLAFVPRQEAARASAGDTCELLLLDQIGESIQRESAESLAVENGAADPAYVMYTSGSTGSPKGICVPHRAITRLVLNTNYIALGPASRVVHGSNVAFDAATFEVWGALLNGGSLICVGKDVLLSPPAFAALLREQQATTLFLTTALFNELAKTVPDIFAGMQYVLFGGEAVTPRWVKTVLEQGPPQHLLHVYGPTENTTYSSWYPVGSVSDAARTIPIGYPIANTQLYVLDSHLHPVPVGIPGELYVAGDGLALGYLNRPELTAEKFIPNLFAQAGSECDDGAGGTRLYKTGDTVRYLPDGSIEFIGRSDGQVKIHGQRIEPGEIEARLSDHPAVHDAVVVVHETDPANRHLVAYIVPAPNRNLTIEELRSFLQVSLPDYMVPATFVFMEALPLTPSGKVDRRALPDAEPGGGGRTYLAPRNAVEIVLAKIWSEVLAVERVGVHDNFFGLGGDSILGIQIISRANEAGLQLTSKHLFQYQTIAELAGAASAAPAAQAEQGIVTGDVPLTPIQHWLFEKDLPDIHHINQAVLLTLTEPFDVAVLEQVFQALLYHHDALRLRFARRAEGWQSSIVPPGDAVQILEVDLSQLPDGARTTVFEQTATSLQTNLNLSAGPLLRAAYFHSDPPERDRLLIVIHHLVMDGVSWRILLEDLVTGYRQLSRGQSIAFALKTASFKYWAEGLVAYAHSDALQAEQDYWLAGLPDGCPALPFDRAIEADSSAVAPAETISVALSAAETDALLRLVPQAYNTQINDALLAALALAVADWQRQPGLLVDLEGHGRESIFEGVDVSRTVGWFTTIFPVYLDLDGNPNPGNALKTVKETLRQIPNHGLGYGLLRYLHPDAAVRQKLAARPRPEMSFNYLGRLDAGVSGEEPFTLSSDFAGSTQGPAHPRAHLIEINSYLARGRLTANWTFDRAGYHRATLEWLAGRFLQALQAIIAHCQSAEAGDHTPSDFALARLDEEKLGKLARMLDQLDQQDINL